MLVDDEVLVIDTETTGLINAVSEIIEIGVLHVCIFTDTTTGQMSYKVLDKFQSLIRPNRGVSEEAYKTHEINEDILMEAPTVSKVRANFIEWWEEKLEGKRFNVLGHNFGCFDSHFLRLFFGTMYDSILDYHAEDNWTLARLLQRKGYLSKEVGLSLGNLTAHLDIPHRVHRGLGDCYATIDVYTKLANLI